MVLGIAQDGGAPQAGCRRECCAARWAGREPRLSVACLGIVDPPAGRWIIDATPDFPGQLTHLDTLAPPASEPGLSGILLTHAHAGHYTGLVHLGREAMGAAGVAVHAMPRLKSYLETDGPWRQLVELGNIELHALGADTPRRLSERVTVTPLAVPHRDEFSETVAYRIDGPARRVLYLPDIDGWERWDRPIEEILAGTDVAFLDGTFYDAGELPHRDVAEFPHPTITSTIRRLAHLPAATRARVRFIHLNHTNPALRPRSAARRAIAAAGFAVAAEGESFGLGAGSSPPAAPPAARTGRPRKDPNPAAPGFDGAGSDAEAIRLADRVMEAMGGRAAWDSARYLTWGFFGARRHVWDKHTGDVRIEGTDRETERPCIVLMNVRTKKGRAWLGGEPVEDPAALAAWLDRGEAWWINDSYWLVAPYKLKDTGVTLRYAGEGTTEAGGRAEVLEMTFKSVGRTPQNRYRIYVGAESGLVEQWDYYEDRSDAEPAFRSPWRNWKFYGRILLSDDRGEIRDRPARLTDIAVLDEIPAAVLSSPAAVDWSKLAAGGTP